MRRPLAGVVAMGLLCCGLLLAQGFGRQASSRDMAGATAAAAAGSASNYEWAVSTQARNLESVSLKRLLQSVGATGAGRTIAVVDTGIDVAIPGFRDASGVLRVRKWLDLTDEGTANVSGPYRAENGRLVVDEVTLDVSALTSLSGTFYVGVVPAGLRTGSSAKETRFVVFDPVVRGSFESVCIDSNGDSGFAGETVLRPFDESGSFAQMPVSAERNLTVVLADVRVDSRRVKFGVDLNGHGTTLAAIAAGGGPGDFRGVAPGCNLMAVKVLSGEGTGAWRDIATGVEAAIRGGVDVVLVGAAPDGPVDPSQWRKVTGLAADYGVPIVLPAGNKGPGAATVNLTRSGETTIVVGGFIPGGAGSDDAWYTGSSVGPNADGNLGVDVLGPARASAPMAGYPTRVRFSDVEGTSVSAAYVAGGMAVLQEASEVRSRVNDGGRLCLALKEGASHVPGALPVEEGYGKADLASAWRLFRQGVKPASFQLARKWNGSVARGGLFLQGTSLGAAPLWIDNLGTEDVIVNLSSSASWLRTQASYMSSGAVSQRMTWLFGEPQLGPGLYSAQIQADDPETAGVDGRLPITAIVPHALDPALERSGIQIDIAGSNRVSRQFFVVPESAEAAKITLHFGGKGLCTLYSPKGEIAFSSLASRTLSFDVGLPQPGIWQLTLVPDPTETTSILSGTRIDIAFQGVIVRSDGIEQNVERYEVVHGPTESIACSAATDEGPAIWRYRRSGSLSVRSATTVSYPLASEATRALSLRLGTVTGSTLKGYLYQYSQEARSWVEVASCSTADGSEGSIYYPDPRSGRYVAYVEAYGEGAAVYGEIDALLLPDLKPLALTSGAEKSSGTAVRSGLRQVRGVLSVPRLDAFSSEFLIVESKADPRVAAVIERPSAEQRLTFPLVQVMGGEGPGPRIRTIRVSTADGRYGLDLVITAGTTSYQTDEGRVTTLIDASLPMYHMTPAGDDFIVDAH